MGHHAARLPGLCARTAETLRREDGFTIIEVLVAAVLVVMTATGVFAALDGAVGVADSNKSRNVAASLAQGDQERMRGMNPSELVALVDTPAPPDPQEVDGETYSVESQAEWVAGAGGATTCTSADAGARSLRISSTVTWPGIEPLKPVTSTSIKAVNNATSAGRGDLAVTIMDRTGAAGVAGVAVSISGPENETQTTNANGCVFFDFIPTGTYTVTFARPGWIESKLPNRQAIEDTVVVASDQTATQAYQYDRPGGIRVRFRTRRPGASSDITVTGDSFTVSNANRGTPPTKSFTGTAANELTTGLVLFPFTNSYTVWAGKCDAAKLPDGFVSPSQTRSVTPNATGSKLDVFAPTMKITVRGYGYALPGARVFVSPATAGCTGRPDTKPLRITRESRTSRCPTATTPSARSSATRGTRSGEPRRARTRPATVALTSATWMKRRAADARHARHPPP